MIPAKKAEIRNLIVKANFALHANRMEDLCEALGQATEQAQGLSTAVEAMREQSRFRLEDARN